MADADNPTRELEKAQYKETLKKLSQLGKNLTSKERMNLEEETNLRFSTTSTDDDTEGYSTTTNSTSNDSDSETSSSEHSRSRRRRRRRNKPKSNKLNKLLINQADAIKGLADAVLNKEGHEATQLKSLINGMSHQSIRKALKQERRDTNKSHVLMQAPTAVHPTLRKSGEAPVKDLRESLQTLKDSFRSTISGTESEGISPFLKIAGTIAKNSNLSPSQFYLLIKSRVHPGSQLSRDVTNHANRNTDLRTFFKETCTLYPGDTGYLTSLRKFEEFRGTGLTASQFLATLKNLATDLVVSSGLANTEENVLNKVRDKFITLLPTIAPTILEKEAATRSRNSSGSMKGFTKTFMSFSDRIESILAKQQKNRIHAILSDQSSDEEPALSVQLITDNKKSKHVLKLTKNQLDMLNNKCYKCGSNSPIQPGKHLGRECILYKDTPLAAYMCSSCNIGVHLPKYCRQKQVQEKEQADSEEEVHEIHIIDQKNL